MVIRGGDEEGDDVVFMVRVLVVCSVVATVLRSVSSMASEILVV